MAKPLENTYKMKARFNPQRRTLEQAEYKYELQDVKEPNLFRDVFTYDEPPYITFNYRLVPMDPPEEIWITDTTFRDGQQGNPPFTVEQITKLYDFLHELSGEIGLIRQSEFFLYTDKDKQAVMKCLEKNYTYPEITGWIRAKKEDFQLVKQLGLKETGILTSCSDYHIFLKLKLTRKQAMEQYLSIVEAAFENDVIPRCHFEDVTRADFYGFVVPFAIKLMELSKQAKKPIKIRLCDTLGLGVIHPGASLPRSVHGIIYGMHHYAEVPSEWLEWHGHNDFYRAVSNATAAWLYGCSAVNGTLLGIGERTGNTPIEALVFEYIGLKGSAGNINTQIITEIAKYFEKEIGYEIPPNQPFVGKNFNKTYAGIHADGLIKDQEIYTIFNTKKILNSDLEIGITDKSGAAGITLWINKNINPSVSIEKTDPAVLKIKEEIDFQYKQGRVTAISDSEMYELVKKYMPHLFK